MRFVWLLIIDWFIPPAALPSSQASCPGGILNSLSYSNAKIMQIEDNTKKMQFFFIVEMQLSLSKDNANRRQYKKNTILFYCWLIQRSYLCRIMYNINVPKAKRCILLFPYKRPLVCMGLEEAMSPRSVVTCCKSCSSCFSKSASRIGNNTNKPITPFSRWSTKKAVATSELFQKTPRPYYQNRWSRSIYALEEIGHTNLPRVVLALGSILA